jgi:hypothetical protein
LNLFTSGRVELLANKKLENELVGLERRTARGGRDSIDHGRGDHDDSANAACGCLLLAATGDSHNVSWAAAGSDGIVYDAAYGEKMLAIGGLPPVERRALDSNTSDLM